MRTPYQWLKAAAPGIRGTRSIKWSFTKLLVGRGGKAVRRYAPAVTPSRLEPSIEALL